LSYVIVGEFLSDLKEEFRGEDDKTIKVAELKKVKQGSRMMKEFVQKFKRVARDSKYEERSLVEEFKRGINGIIRQKLMESEYSLKNIEQWHQRVTNLDKH